MNKIILIIVLLIFIAIVLYIFSYRRNKNNATPLEDFNSKPEQIQIEKPAIENKLVLYYSQWCGHCPDYIKGYPTVMLYKQNGQKITFSGQRTVEELRKFISN
jgi:thiol-disulfide isomerase/thioredoxin